MGKHPAPFCRAFRPSSLCHRGQMLQTKDPHLFCASCDKKRGEAGTENLSHFIPFAKLRAILPCPQRPCHASTVDSDQRDYS